MELFHVSVGRSSNFQLKVTFSFRLPINGLFGEDVILGSLK